MTEKGYAIVTGGSRGIGASICLQLAHEGFNIVLNYTSDSSKCKAQELVKKMRDEHNVHAIAVQADVSDYEQCRKIFDTAVKEFGNNIEVLVNNAGIRSSLDEFVTKSPKNFASLIKINLFGVMFCTHIVLPNMIKQKKGNIINMSSTAGLVGVVTQVDYSASKAGIIGFTKSLAKEVGKHNIRVNCIAPGYVLTDILKDESGNFTKEKEERMIGLNVLDYIGEPKDISDCVSYILKAKYMTGQVISLNGGEVI